jgi:RNA polymerase sigma-70 factor (ECF subfamily)
VGAPLASTNHSATPSSSADEQHRFVELFESTFTPVTAYARRRVADRAEADDVVAETYAVAWRRRGQLDPDAPPLPWLYGIAANVIRNHHRSRSRRLRLADKLEAQTARSGVPHPIGGDPGDRPADDLRTALASLADDDQEVLRLVAWEGLAHAEIGQILGCSTNAVGLRVHRARQRLRAALVDQSGATTGPTPDPPSDAQPSDAQPSDAQPSDPSPSDGTPTTAPTTPTPTPEEDSPR